MAQVKRHKKFPLIWSAAARNELREIIAYIKQDSPNTAGKIAAKIREKSSRLTFFPNSGRILPEFPEMPYREIIVEKYRIIYLPMDTQVAIIAIRHSRRGLSH